VTTQTRLRTAVAGLYGIAIGGTALYGNGRIVVGVAVIGALAVGVCYRLLAPPDADGDRRQRRAARRETRRGR
jgi:hypothetical protein